jgi:hypothetical protein
MCEHFPVSSPSSGRVIGAKVYYSPERFDISQCSFCIRIFYWEAE